MVVDTTEASHKTQAIRAGRRVPVEDRQVRYDRMLLWHDAGLSLAQIAKAEAEVSGVLLTRERVRAILGTPRPGTFYKGSKIGDLRMQIAEMKVRQLRWKEKHTPRGDIEAAQYGKVVAELKLELKAAEREARQISAVIPG